MKGISTCPNCHIQFSWERNSTQVSAKYCSNKCRLEHKKAKATIYGKSNCEQCGKEFFWKRPIHQGPAKRCSLKCNPKYLIGQELWEYKLKLYNERVVKNENACWDWIGIVDTIQGYAKIQVQRKNISAHRISWMIHKGEIPKGKQINHHCDNRRCTNPDHLYLGTQKENDDDRVRRDRQAKGSKNAAAKLEENQVKEIKKLIQHGYSQQKIACIFHVCRATISNIVTGKNWKHIV